MDTQVIDLFYLDGFAFLPFLFRPLEHTNAIITIKRK